MSAKVTASVLSPPARSFTPAPANLLQRQCACGGSAGLSGKCETCQQKTLTGQQPPLIQPKLKISQPNDPYEQEADRVAEQVMRMPEPTVQRAAASSKQDQDNENKGKDGLVQRKVAGPAPASSYTASHPFVGNLGSGQPLDAGTRSFFEPRFGHDLSHVRVHADTLGAESAHSVQAKAYTLGRDVVFGQGQFAPGTYEGRRLMAHEIVHTFQQGPIRLTTLGQVANSVVQRDPKKNADRDMSFREIGIGNTVRSRRVQALIMEGRLDAVRAYDLSGFSDDELLFLREYTHLVLRKPFSSHQQTSARDFLNTILSPAIQQKEVRTEQAARLREDRKRTRAIKKDRIEKGRGFLEAEPEGEGIVERSVLSALRVAVRTTRSARDAALAGLRKLVALESPSEIAIYDPLLVDIELITDSVLRLPLAIAALGAGLTLGALAELKGLLALALLPFQLVKALFERKLLKLLRNILKGVARLPSAILEAIGKWYDEYTKADDIEQTAKIAVLFGRLEALILAAFTGAAAGKAASVALSRTTKAASEAVELVAERLARPRPATAGGPAGDLASAAVRPRAPGGLSPQELIRAEARGKAVGGTLGGATGPSQQALKEAQEAGRRILDEMLEEAGQQFAKERRIEGIFSKAEMPTVEPKPAPGRAAATPNRATEPHGIPAPRTSSAANVQGRTGGASAGSEGVVTRPAARTPTVEPAIRGLQRPIPFASGGEPNATRLINEESGGRLRDPGGGLVELFNRQSGSSEVTIQGAQGEWRQLRDLVHDLAEDPNVVVIEYVKSSSAAKSTDVKVTYRDGRVREIEFHTTRSRTVGGLTQAIQKKTTTNKGSRQETQFQVEGGKASFEFLGAAKQQAIESVAEVNRLSKRDSSLKQTIDPNVEYITIKVRSGFSEEVLHWRQVNGEFVPGRWVNGEFVLGRWVEGEFVPAD